MDLTDHKSDPSAATPKQPYGSFSMFGVPYSKIDIRYAAEALFETYNEEGVKQAMINILNQNERVVSRCGMLISFSGTLIALSLFVANKPDMLPMRWQQWLFYSVMLLWVVLTMWLLWSLKHKFPPIWEYHTKDDFMLTAGLFLKRMGIYNLALLATIISFTSVVFVLSPISAVISDRLFDATDVSPRQPRSTTGQPVNPTGSANSISGPAADALNNAAFRAQLAEELFAKYRDQLRGLVGPAGPAGKDGMDGTEPSVEDVATALIRDHSKELRHLLLSAQPSPHTNRKPR